jgi:hypothetical protein
LEKTGPGSINYLIEHCCEEVQEKLKALVELRKVMLKVEAFGNKVVVILGEDEDETINKEEGELAVDD